MSNDKDKSKMSRRKFLGTSTAVAAGGVVAGLAVGAAAGYFGASGLIEPETITKTLGAQTVTQTSTQTQTQTITETPKQMSMNAGYLSTLSTVVQGQRMIDQELARKYNLDVNFRQITNPGDSSTALASGDLDLVTHWGLGSAGTVHANVRKIYVPWPMQTGTNTILAQEGTDIQEIMDLKGKTIGAFTVNASSLFLAVYNLINDGKNIDYGDVGVIRSPPPVLVEKLRAGELPAIEVPEPFATLEPMKGGVVKLANINEEWIKVTGNVLPDVVTGCTGTYADDNPEAITAMIQAMEEARQWVLTNPTLLADWAEKAYHMPRNIAEISSQANLTALQIPYWDDEFLESTRKYVDVIVKSRKLPEIDVEWITNKFNPK